MASKREKLCKWVDGAMIDPDHSYFGKGTEKKKGGK